MKTQVASARSQC